jgi:uncharacterized protein (TIGR02594 family)
MSALRHVQGCRELPGKATNPVIAEMHASLGLGHADDEVAWCSSAVAWSFQRCGMLIPEGVTTAARSWLHGKGLITLDKPCLGAIAVLWRVSRTDWRGHVGFVEGVGGGYVQLLGGNQRNTVGSSCYHVNGEYHGVLEYMWPRCYDPRAFPLDQ